MRLDATDRRFIALVAGDEAPFVTFKLEQRSALANAMSPTHVRSLASRLSEYAKLALRAALTWRTSSRASEADSVVFVREPEQVEGRLEFHRLFSPGERFFPLHRNATLARPADPASARRMLAGLLPLVLATRRDSELAPHYITIVRACLLVSSHAKVTHSQTAHLWKAFRIENGFMTAYLRRCGLRSDVVVETTPMAPYNRHLLADTVTLTNPYHVDEARAFAASARVGGYRLWGPTDAPSLERTYDGVDAPDLPGVVAVYTQGYWLRVRRGTCDATTAAVMVPLEDEFAGIVAELARRNPEVRFVVFPHPMERRYFAETGDRGPAWFEGIENVAFSADGEGGSTGAFRTVGLGLTTVSTIGFDRVYMGYRTLFYTGNSPQIDTSVPSRFNALFFRDRERFAAAVETERLRTHAESMAAHFDAGSYPPWSAAAPGKSRRTAPVTGSVPAPGRAAGGAHV